MFSKILGVSLLVASLALPAVAHADNRGWGHDPSPAPELDPNFIGGGLALLIGGALLLAERRRSSN